MKALVVSNWNQTTGATVTDDVTGEDQWFVDDPAGGLSVDLMDLSLIEQCHVSLSDRELLELLKKVPRLKEITFHHRQLNDLSQLSSITGLEVIKTWRKLRSTDLAAITKLKTLKRLSWTIESDDELNAVSEMGALESLRLASKNVTDIGVERICRMQSLRRILLSETGISSKGLQILEGMPNVDTIRIVFGNGFNDQALHVLDGSRKVRNLALGRGSQPNSQIRITDAGLEFVGRVANLEELDLHYIPITDLGIKHLLKLKNLRTLRLTATHITNSSLEELGALQSLSMLDIVGCEKLTDVGLLQLQNVGSLRMLFASYWGSGITKDGVVELRRLRPELMIIDH